MLGDMSDAMASIDWDFSVSAPAGPVIITGTFQASTAKKAAELALEAAVQIVPGLVEAIVTVRPEGVSAGIRLNLVVAQFSVEMGPDGLELELDFALDSRGLDMQAEAEITESQPGQKNSTHCQRQVEEPEPEPEPEPERVSHRPQEQVFQRDELELERQRQSRRQPEVQEQKEAGG
jgi:hypothetical protein